MYNAFSVGLAHNRLIEIMTSNAAKLVISKDVITRVCTLVGILLIASGSSRIYVITSFRGEILIAIELVLLLWTINIILTCGGLVEIIGAMQVFRGNLISGRQLIAIGIIVGLIALIASLIQQVFIPLHFYDFVMSDLIGWIGIGIGIVLRINMK